MKLAFENSHREMERILGQQTAGVPQDEPTMQPEQVAPVAEPTPPETGVSNESIEVPNPGMEAAPVDGGAVPPVV